MTAWLITLESTEGAGKGSNAGFIHELIQVSGFQCIRTREVGGTPLAEDLRVMMLHPNRDYAIDGMDEALIATAGRYNHQRTVVDPHLAKGCHVLSERWYDSTVAYQGYGRQIGVDVVMRLHDIIKVRVPDLSFLLDIDPEVGMERIQKRTIADRQEHESMPVMDRIELEQMDYFQRCRKGYLDQVKHDNAWRWHVIDASKPLADVRRQIANVLIDKGLATVVGLEQLKGKYDVS